MSIDATEPQIGLMVNLLDGLGLTYAQMNAQIKRCAGRNVKWLDDLTVEEADAIIKHLKAMKAQPVESAR